MLPILWSFRRCPYAMRARLALCAAGQGVALQEIVLRAKPEAFLAASPSGTVPCLDTGTQVIDESLDIMTWALGRNDPAAWLDMPPSGHALIAECDGPFKAALDRYKYDTRYADADPVENRTKASAIIETLEAQLNPWLFGKAPRLADMAILPFIRQFAHVDLDWFSAQPWPKVQHWLTVFKQSDEFAAIMGKYAPWQPGDPVIHFPEVTDAS